MRGAQAGVLLVVIVLLASITVLVMTTTFTREVPSVQRETTSALIDVRTTISQGILDWTSDTAPQLACNGVYDLDEQHFLDTLRPYIEERITQSGSTTQGNIEITTGTLTNLTFDGLTGFTITLSDGTIIYDDGTIYSENSQAQELFFNNRFPLAMNVVQDWLMCDAGNLSSHLATAFGDECFFGKMDPSYPGGCPTGPQLDISDPEREFMRSVGITPTKVSQGVVNSLDELNKYFEGTNSCNNEPIGEDTGISCRFEISDLDIEQEFTPWITSKVVVLEETGHMVTARHLHAMGQRYGYPLEYRSYIDSSDRVYSLPGKITMHGYPDEELMCSQEPPRAPTQGAPGIGGLPEYDVSYDMGVSLTQQNYQALNAHPAIYVNTTRGANLQVKVTCTDSRVSLLGQQLEYSFSFSHGIQQHCGPDLMEPGSFACAGCGLKPGLDFSQCVEFAVPNCDTAEQECINSLVWSESVREGSQFEWQGSVSATLNEYPDLQEYIDGMCEVTQQWDPELQRMVDVCPSPQTVVCCMVPGFQYDCDPATSFDNQDCYYSQTEYTALCTQELSCSASGCMNYECDLDINECVETDPLPAGTECPGDCSTCDGEGNCAVSAELEGDTCGAWSACRTGMCTAQGCEYEATNEGNSCALGVGATPQCATGVCTGGACTRVPANEGAPCSGSPPAGCEGTFTCQGGYCQVDGTFDCGDGGGSCPCGVGSDGSCRPC